LAGIVFLARGPGYRHAARDLQIICGPRPCHDFGIDDRHDPSEEAARRVWGFLQTLRDPDLVIADEWYGLSLLAPVFRLPLTMARRSMARFSTDWRPLPRR
jgi:hypothetical protein